MRQPAKPWRPSITRRNALRSLAGFLAGSPLLRSQQDAFRDHSRVPGFEELITTFDFEALAFAKLPTAIYDYTAHGADDEQIIRRNRRAFGWVKLVPRAIADASSVDTTTELLGARMAFPLLVAPTSGHGALHPEGELETHRGATAASNTPFIVSNGASFPIDEIAKAATGPLWFQLYAREDFDANLPTLERVQAAGCQAVAMTVDQRASFYERTQHNRNFSGRGTSRAGRGRREEGPPNPYRIRLDRLWYNWSFVERVRPYVKVPLLLKGIVTAEDARLSVENGVDGIIVSNHGGRSMNYGVSTLEMLPEIVAAVAGRIPVLIDSGFCRGSDILKALALGANAVCVGRMSRWGLATFGALGVQRVLEIMQGELVAAMAHTGRPTLASIDRTLVRADFP